MPFLTRAALAEDLRRLGLRPGGSRVAVTAFAVAWLEARFGQHPTEAAARARLTRA